MDDLYIKEKLLRGELLTEEEMTRIEFLNFTEEEAKEYLHLMQNETNGLLKKDLALDIRIKKELERGTSFLEIITSLNESLNIDKKEIAKVVLTICLGSTASHKCTQELLDLIDSLKKEGYSNDLVAFKIESMYGFEEATVLKLVNHTSSSIKKNMLWILFWIVILIVFLLGLFISIELADDSRSIRSIAIITIFAYSSWWIMKKIKSIYQMIKGKK